MSQIGQHLPLRQLTALGDSGHSAILPRALFAASSFPDWIVFRAPRPQLTNGALLVKVGRLRSNLARSPSRKADFINDVLSGCGVQFSNLCKVRLWKSLRKSHQCGPQTTVHIGDFSVNEPAHTHISAISDRAGDGEYFATARVPTSCRRSVPRRWSRRATVQVRCQTPAPIRACIQKTPLRRASRATFLSYRLRVGDRTETNSSRVPTPTRAHLRIGRFEHVAASQPIVPSDNAGQELG
jgi:hypothetical protein